MSSVGHRSDYRPKLYFDSSAYTSTHYKTCCWLTANIYLRCLRRYILHARSTLSNPSCTACHPPENEVENDVREAKTTTVKTVTVDDSGIATDSSTATSSTDDQHVIAAATSTTDDLSDVGNSDGVLKWTTDDELITAQIRSWNS